MDPEELADQVIDTIGQVLGTVTEAIDLLKEPFIAAGSDPVFF